MGDYTTYHGENYDSYYMDQYLRGYFPNYVYKGVFFDVGAFEPVRISNSHHFYMNGWDVYSFEANPNNVKLLREQRVHVFPYAISKEDKNNVDFKVVFAHDWTASYSALSLNEEYKTICGWNDYHVDTIKVNQRTLDTIIKTEIPNVQRIDILSIDVEGGELDCLKGLNIQKYTPRVMLIENVLHTEDVTKYLQPFGYHLDKIINYNYFYSLTGVTNVYEPQSSLYNRY